MEFLTVKNSRNNKFYLQVCGDRKADGRWDFYLTDGESAWDGGFGIADNATLTPTKRIVKRLEAAKDALQGGYASVNLRRYSFEYLYKKYWV
jgi:hypothetical protein